MDSKQWQEFVLNAQQHFTTGISEVDFAVVALGLAGETGEVVEHLKKYLRDGVINQDALTKELGDVLSYIVLLGRYFDITLEDVMEANHQKISSRIERGMMKGSGDNR